MTTTTESAGTIDDTLARRNALLLSVAQALGGSSATIVFATTSILGASLLGADKSLATLPVTAFVLGTALGTLPAGLIMRHFGRRVGFSFSMLLGFVFSLIAALAAYYGHFYLLCFSTLGTGLVAAFVQQFRFAAADTASDGFKPKAISLVLAGGILAGVIGPQTVIWTKDLFEPFLFVGTYLAQAVLSLIAFFVVVNVRVPLPPKRNSVGHKQGRPLSYIMKQPSFVVAVLCGMISYAIMSLVMTSAPLAMIACGLTETDAALGIQWHVVAMFGPSFITGNLITRFGALKIMGVGFGLYLLCSMVALTGLELWIFWSSLVLLGLGWNFSFVGATTLLTQTYRDEERNMVQAFNDFLVFGLVAISSFSSGKLLHSFGWETVNTMVFPFIAVCLVSLIWLGLRRKTESIA
ncbi:MFS transporter [Pseudovibrio exalbescens]|uniref:MFS transporter n=1 Tax=Pseudovibrio exalbescens TaxID=197461 RepID=UPI002365E85A|nr:MFS transporter [Pseudovibrio exalbescens]MDD7908392.1 MFS transporter [Pseudovibrio exalbescens]